MAKPRFKKNMLIISVASVVLTLFTYVFVSHHLDTPNRVLEDRINLLSSGPDDAERR